MIDADVQLLDVITLIISELDDYLFTWYASLTTNHIIIGEMNTQCVIIEETKMSSLLTFDFNEGYRISNTLSD